MAYRSFVLTGVVLLPLLLVPLLPSPATIPSTPWYSITDLGALPGDEESFAWGISESGAIVGGSQGPEGVRAFLWTREGGIQALPCPAGRPLCIARDVNDAGQAVGSAWASPVDIPGHAIRWTAGVPEDLGTLVGGTHSEAWGINEIGDVVGNSYTTAGTGPHGFVYEDGGGMTDITGGSSAGYTFDINDAGQRVGHRREALGYRGYLWEDGIEIGIGVLPMHAHTYALGVSSSGIVSGYSRSAGGEYERIVRFREGVGLESLGGIYNYNRGWGVNRFGVVVGEGRPASGLVRGVVYTDTRGLEDMNLLIDRDSGWFILAATGINDAGQVVGHGTSLATGRVHAVLLSPPGYQDAPMDLRADPAGDAVRLTWNPPEGSELFRVYGASDRFAPWPWEILGETVAPWFDVPSHFTDEADHFYIVRAIVRGLEGPNSTMAVKLRYEFAPVPGRTNIAWFSMPYRTAAGSASALVALAGPGNVDLVGRWDAASGASTVYYRVDGTWRGTDFLVHAGDALFFGVTRAFSIAVLGSDARVSLSVSSDVGPVWLGLPATGVYRRASDVASELGHGRVLEVGRWDPASQSVIRWSWTGFTWAGEDFLLAPGDPIVLSPVADFAWTPRLETPDIP